MRTLINKNNLNIEFGNFENCLDGQGKVHSMPLSQLLRFIWELRVVFKPKRTKNLYFHAFAIQLYRERG